MLYYKILTPNPFADFLTYAYAEDIAIGSQVLVPYGSKKVYGFVWSVDDQLSISLERIKTIEEVTSSVIFNDDWIKWMVRMSTYYHIPPAVFLIKTLPSFLWKKIENLSEAYMLLYDEATYKPYPLYGGIMMQEGLIKYAQLEKKQNSLQKHIVFHPAPFVLHASQYTACQAIHLTGFQVYALQGPTGSGKTEVYLDRLCALAQTKPVLLMMPEITLTSSMVIRLTARLGSPPWVYHSQISPKTRSKHFLAAAKQTPGLWIGTRSAVFLPARWAMVVIDEEHDNSYVQSQSVYYAAKHMMIMRAKMLDIPIVLGSATLSLETLYNAQKHTYRLLQLTKNYHAPVKSFVLDARKEVMFNGLLMPIWHAIDQHVAQGHQVLLFLNRRGYAPVLLCTRCGWKAECKHCDVALVVHERQKQLRCHYCDYRVSIPEICIQGHKTLKAIGLGTQKLEEFLGTRYPNVPLLRIDQDSTQKERQMLEKFLVQGGAGIIVGTQMISKGLDAPAIRCVVVVHLDGQLMRSEFTSDEQAYQLLAQVMGRAARRERGLTTLEDSLWIQTYIPKHPLWHALLNDTLSDYPYLLLSWRHQQGLPPYSYVCLVRLEHKKEDELKKATDSIRKKYDATQGWKLFGPFPSLVCRRKNYYHYVAMMVAPTRKVLDYGMEDMKNTLKLLKVTWQLERDAQETIG